MSNPYKGAERREHSDLVDAMREAVRQELRAVTISVEAHSEHHAFLEAWIERHRIRAQRWETIKTQIGGWAILGLLGSVATGVVIGAKIAFAYMLNRAP